MASWTISSVWQETRDIVRAKAWVFAPIAAAFVLLPYLIAARFFPDTRTSIFDTPSTDAAIASIVVSVIGVVAEVAILSIVLSPREAERSVGDVLGEAARLTPAMFGLKLLVGIATLGGLLLLILPGLYLTGRLAPAVPAMVGERLGVLDSLRRGWALGEGQVWRILGFILLLVLAGLGAILLLSAVAAAAGLVLRVLGIEGVDRMLVLLATATIWSALTVYGWTGIAVIYRRIVAG
jgi:hypothetical protein